MTTRKLTAALLLGLALWLESYAAAIALPVVLASLLVRIHVEAQEKCRCGDDWECIACTDRSNIRMPTARGVGRR